MARITGTDAVFLVFATLAVLSALDLSEAAIFVVPSQTQVQLIGMWFYIFTSLSAFLVTSGDGSIRPFAT